MVISGAKKWNIFFISQIAHHYCYQHYRPSLAPLDQFDILILLNAGISWASK